MSRLERPPPWAIGTEPPYPTHDLNVLAAALAAGEIGSEQSLRAGWVATYAPDAETVGYLDDAIPGPASILHLPSTLGRWLCHTLLRAEHGRQWPHLEKWELDWAVADHNGHQDRRAPASLEP